MKVADAHAGKRGKCPKCARTVAVPPQSTLIPVSCTNCAQTTHVPQNYAGKKIACPQCKNACAVPELSKQALTPAQADKPQSKLNPAESTGSLTLVDVPDEYKISRRPPTFPDTPGQALDTDRTGEEPPTEDTEPIGGRKLPWPIDIFLYPTSPPGLIHLAIFAGVPIIMGVLLRLLGPFRMALGLPAWIVRILIGLYMLWYLAECIRDSAQGRTRAPEAFATAGAGEMYSQALHIVGCYMIFVVPPLWYHFLAQRHDTIFWALVAYGVFFFPMGLLACIMFDSVRGLNPIILIPSIFSTFFQYCGLVILVAAIILGVWATGRTLMPENPQQRPTIGFQILGAAMYCASLYVSFVVAHLLGRFYYRYQQKLNWEV